MVAIAVAAFQPAAGAATDDDDVLARTARRDLRDAEKTYGDIRVPDVPRGFRLTRVSQGGVGLDLWWHRDKGDGSIHLWQTRNGELLENKSDPSNPDTGVPIRIGGTTWNRNTINALNRPGFLGGSGYWIPTISGSVCWAA